MSYRVGTRGTAPERFWARVNKNGPVPPHRPELGPCWLWTAGRSSGGYGKLFVDGKIEYAHRYAYKLQVGPLEDDEKSCHACDMPPCQRGEHLFKGTQDDNLKDMAAKGRSTLGAKNPSRRYPTRVQRGDQHWTRRNPERARELATIMRRAKA